MSYKELQAIKDVLEHKQGNYLDDEINALITGVEYLQSENTRLKAERDKAVGDLENLIDCHCACSYCANLMPDGTCEAERKYGVCTCLPKWKGLEESE